MSSGITYKPGTMVRDMTRDRIACVMESRGNLLWLRRPEGGREWEARPEEVEPISASESLRPRVAEANRRSREAL
ncbi:hypothetical protein [Streptomyces aidingensis]|uniref:Uncharacterized protein n=1 Tax=Streptomyces aidingensis TaxID=910347 RepID=A0A1I1QTE0_9ACTN|nr:hypothetical protein [Streptomyces aidingensis]SFD21310.1 hypothetical protein SAMN05421773_111102 [Streptomyces aidingensis]